MGIRLFLSVFLWVYFSICVLPIVSVLIPKGDTICDLKGCNCTKKASVWKILNCTLNNVQEIEIGSEQIPNEIVEIFINGGRQITFTSQSINKLPGLTLLHIDEVQKLVMEQQSFYNLTSPSLLIQIQNCDRLIIKTGAFDNMQSSIEVEITRCAYVSLEKSAFNKLLIGRFKDIPQLMLSTKSFEFKNQGNLRKHGAVTTITFDNVIIPTIPQRTFFSSLAAISIRNSEIHDIFNEAFWANEIHSISIINSTINRLRTHAFTGRTLIVNFKITKCILLKLESKAVVAAISNLTVQHSSITDIKEEAINSTIANVDITGNEISNFGTNAFIIHDWSKINIEQNIIKYLRSHFLIAPVNPAVVQLVFKDNDVFNLEPGALSFVPELDEKFIYFENNYFNQTCHCFINEWIEELIIINQSKKIKHIMSSTFCTINKLLATCFELEEGVINIQNFTELVCNSNNTIICEPYNGETKIVNTTSKMLSDDKPMDNTSWITLIITCTSLLVIAVVVTTIILLIRGSRWLKRKGYFLNIHYNQNEPSNDEEITTVTEDESDKFDIPKELTEELLQTLRERLNDPDTKQEASEMIERLYDMFIVDDNYENNNRQQEEAHLYEELGNLQVPQQYDQEQDKLQTPNGARSIQQLNEIEQKLYPQIEYNSGLNNRPALVVDYSEPSDAAEHLYSELKNRNEFLENGSKGSLKSTSSYAFRPLPDKPEEEQGHSSQI